MDGRVQKRLTSIGVVMTYAKPAIEDRTALAAELKAIPAS